MSYTATLLVIAFVTLVISWQALSLLNGKPNHVRLSEAKKQRDGRSFYDAAGNAK